MSGHRPFDLARLDTEGRRKRLRKKLLLYSLPIVVLVLPMALKLTSLSFVTAVASSQYDTEKFDESSRTFKGLLWLNVIESYKAHYNYGSSLVMAKQYEKAQAALERALLGAPVEYECFVRLNLVYAYKLPADQAMEQKDYEQAIILYDKVKAVVDARDCGITYQDGQAKADGASEETMEANEQMDKEYKDASEKQAEAKRAQNGDESEDGEQDESASQDATTGTPSQDQQEQLQQQQQQADQQARRSRAVDQYIDREDTQFYNGKQW